MVESLYFTAINPDDIENENRINIDVNPDGNFAINGFPIDAQQMAELGMLLFALANRGVPSDKPDLDSCAELLDGFEIPLPIKALKKVLEDFNA
jgi:hypothetical protein